MATAQEDRTDEGHTSFCPITATEKPTENEKYAFRCFLLRLGFIGPEYKQERKFLLKNLSGNGSYKSGSR